MADLWDDRLIGVYGGLSDRRGDPPRLQRLAATDQRAQPGARRMGAAGQFCGFGVITIWTAFAWRIFLKGGAVWYPIFRGLQGLGLIIDGFFSQDPAPGYPKGAVPVPPTFHGIVHVIFAFVAITAIALDFFVIARRFAKEPHWRGWATFAVIWGILTIVFIAIFGTLNGQHSQIAGVFERLATAPATIFGIVFLTRLWLGTGFGRFQKLPGE